MTHIYFNPWLERYKQPFGAVQEGAMVNVWLSVPEQQNTKVFLVVRKEGSSVGQKIFTMEPATEDRFHFQTIMDQGWGLYFYYFKIVNEAEGHETIQYYGFKGQGGEGRIYGHFVARNISEEIEELYSQIKDIFDPMHILNPGVKGRPNTKELVKSVRNGK